MTLKPTKYSTALVFYSPDRSKVLLVQRPFEDDRLPGCWGFPAATKTHDNEPWENVVHRASENKLGVKVNILGLIGEDRMDRGKYELCLRDYEVSLKEGQISVPQKGKEGTQYIDFQWTSNFELLLSSAKAGSVCSRIFLNSKEIPY